MNFASTLLVALRNRSSVRSRQGVGVLLSVCACLVLAACGGGGGGSSSSTATPVASTPVAPAAVVNTIPVTVDQGPVGANAFNVPFVSVTVCRPGTSICQTIDHILLDTGSYGLRLLAPLNTSLGLPQVKWPSGDVAAECSPFISGFTWGSTAIADVKLGGEVAASQTIQLVGDHPNGVTTIPSDCTSVGNNIGTLAALGAKGMLGVGLLKEDCGNACVNSAISGAYYACSSATSSCTPVTMPLQYQVSNPVASFSKDNNGVILTMPAIAPGGAKSIAGTLTFGIGTQANNAIQGESKYVANSSGDFTTVYKGVSMTKSFIDSGSNGLFFDDASLTKCVTSTDFYCPTTSESLTATTMSYDGSGSGDIAFTIENVDNLSAGATAAYAGGVHVGHQSNGFDWGLPFFFGRRVFVGFAGTTGGGYWAY